jgi:hypothetical protein
MSAVRLVTRGISRRAKLAIVAGLSTFLVLVGSSAGFAYWTAANTVTSTVGGATLVLTPTNFTSNAYTFSNDASLVTTGSVTVTNSTVTTSTQSGSVSLTFGAAATSTLAGLVTLNVWSTAAASNCTAAATVPANATTVLWSAGTTFTTTLADNASVIYCLRSSITSAQAVASSGGSISFTPQITGTIKVGNFVGSASATTTQSTSYVYPAATNIDVTHWNWIRPNFSNTSYNYCLDVSGAATTSGTIVISYGCKNAGVSNQQWKFTASGATGYYTIQPRNSTGLRIDNNSTPATGGSVSVNTAAGAPATATNQQWQLQLVSTGVYEFVNAYSGMCLTSPTGADQNLGNLTQSPCAGTVYQQYKISQAFENFTCATSGTAWTWSWTTATTGPYHVMVTHGTTTTELVTTAATASGATLAFTTPTTYGQNTYNVSFVDANNTVVGSGTITVGSRASNNSCTANDLQ